MAGCLYSTLDKIILYEASMNRRKIAVMFACLSIALNAATSGDENLRVLPQTLDGVNPSDMMKCYLLRQARQNFEKWNREYDQLKTSQQITEYQKRLREKFIEAIGGLPEQTALKPQVTGIVQRNGYRVEKVIFESQPKHYVTAALFMPDSERFKPPYPAVLEPVGHSFAGKAQNMYQTVGALMALNGMAALVFDPIEQGERGQLLSEWPRLWGVTAHTMVGVGSILLGRNTARFEIWDGMRAIDYLRSRPEVDPNRIGCVGLSGGGTQTSYLMALDDRIMAASPACYITNFDRLLSTIGPQDAEQNIYGQLTFGMDHADYLMMRAPRPTMVCAATKDFFDIDGTWTSFRYAKRLYSRTGFAERVELIEHDGDHGYHPPMREATVRWMMRWLRGKDEPITEPNIELLSEKEIQCTPDGQMMLLEGARSTYDLNRDFEKQLASKRHKLWSTMERAELLARVRKLTGIRTLTELPEPKVEKVGVINRAEYNIDKLILKHEDGIYLPALMFVAKQTSSQNAVLYVHEKGKDADANEGGPIENLVNSGHLVLAVDLRGTGETQQTAQTYFMPHCGSDGQDFYTAYLLGRSYVGMRAEDILVCTRLLQQKQQGRVDLVAVGHVSVPALHAAALESDIFGSVRLVRPLVSWSNVIELGLSYNQLVSTVHGALTTYDLPDLAGILEAKLTIEQPLNALGKPIEVKRVVRSASCVMRNFTQYDIRNTQYEVPLFQSSRGFSIFDFLLNLAWAYSDTSISSSLLVHSSSTTNNKQ
jgi:cephalosporin-C deacetylase-like acetyl esterase